MDGREEEGRRGVEMERGGVGGAKFTTRRSERT